MAELYGNEKPKKNSTSFSKFFDDKTHERKYASGTNTHTDNGKIYKKCSIIFLQSKTNKQNRMKNEKERICCCFVLFFYLTNE